MENEYVNEWEKIHSSMEWGEWPSIDVVRFISRKYRQNCGQIKVLDFGCGTGANAWFLARKGLNVFAFDVSKTAIEKAKNKMVRENVNIAFDVMNGLHLEYANEMFDCIIDSACIYANTMENIIKAYEECYRVLKWGGVLYSTGNFTINTSGVESGKQVESNTYINIKEGALAGRSLAHFYANAKELEIILKKIGFKNIVIDKTNYTDNENIIEYYMYSCEK